MVRRAKALHAWDEAAGAAPDDLHFAAGQDFELVSESEPGSGWYTGRINGVDGIFPGNFVQVVEVPEDAPVAVAPAAATGRTRAAAPVAAGSSPATEEAQPAAVTAAAAELEATVEDAADEEEPPPVITRARSRTSGERELAPDAAAIAERAAAPLWDGKDDQQRAAEAARARREAKKAPGLPLTLEGGAEEETSDVDEAAHVPMTPAERRAEWKLQRQQTAEKAEAVAPANPMLQSVDSEIEAGDGPAAETLDPRAQWKLRRQMSAAHAEELAPGSASPPPTRAKPGRPRRTASTDSEGGHDQEADPLSARRGTAGGRRRLSIAEFKDLMAPDRNSADDPAAAAAAATRAMMLSSGDRRGSDTQQADPRAGGARRRLSISQFKDLLDPSNPNNPSPSYGRRGSVSSDKKDLLDSSNPNNPSPSYGRRGSVSSDNSEGRGSFTSGSYTSLPTSGRRKMSSEMVLPSPIPEQHSKKIDDLGSERDAAVARLRTRRMSVQQNSGAMAAFRGSSSTEPAQGKAPSATNSADSSSALGPNAERVVLSGQEYQLEYDQLGLQLYTAAGTIRKMVKQFRWEDIKSWSEKPNSSLSITLHDDSVFEFQMGRTGQICQEIKEHTEMLQSTRNRERADHDAALERATRSEEKVTELQQELEDARSDVARHAAELQAEKKLKVDAQEAVQQHAEELAELRANAKSSSSELEQRVTQLNAEMRSQRGELDRAASDLANAKRTHAAEMEQGVADLAAEQRAKSNLEGRVADVERAKSSLEDRLIQLEEDLSAVQRAKFSLEEAKGTLERRNTELQREVADVRQDLTQAVEARRAAEARCDEIARSARQAAGAMEEDHSSKLRLAQERYDDAMAESARLRREISDLEDSTARRVAKLMEDEATKNAAAERALSEATRRAEQASAVARTEVEEHAAASARKADSEAQRLVEQAEARCSRLRDEYEIKLADAQRRVAEAEAKGKTSVQQDLMLARSEASTMRQQLSGAESQVEEIARKLSTTEAELRQVRGQASEFETATASAKSSCAMVESRLADVQGQLAEAERALAASLSKEQTVRDELEQVSTAAEESTRRLEKMKAELASTLEDKEALEDASESDRRELRRLRLASSDAEEEASAAAARHRKELSAVEDRTSAELAALQDKLRTAQSELEAEKSAARAANDEVERAQSRVGSLRTELEQVRQEHRQQQFAAVAGAQIAASQVSGTPHASGGMWMAPPTTSSPLQPQMQHVAVPQPAPLSATQSVPPPSAPPPSAPSSPRRGGGEERPGGIASEIRALAQLQDDAIISAEEFKKAKAGLLNSGTAVQVRSVSRPLQQANERSIAAALWGDEGLLEQEQMQAASAAPAMVSQATMAGRLAARRERRAHGYAAGVAAASAPLSMHRVAPPPLAAAWAARQYGGASAQLSQLSHYQSIIDGHHEP